VIRGILVTALALCALAPGAAGQQPRDSRRPVLTGTAAVAGIVLADDGERRPLRRARVVLSSSDPDVSQTFITGDDGRFAFERLPGGRYNLTASKEGYVPMSAGSATPGRPGLGVETATGGTRHVELRLPRGAVITGRLLTATGEPAAGVRVSALTRRYVATAGEHRLVNTPNSAPVTTDDRGVYRIFGLPAGGYVIAAQPVVPFTAAGVQVLSEAEVRAALAEVRVATTAARPGLPPQAQRARAAEVPRRSVSFTPIYYPGTSTAARAAVVTVRAGEVRSSVDFDLEAVPAATVEGFAGFSVPGGRLIVTLAQTDRTLDARPRTQTASPDGRFSFRGVPPGDYQLSATSGSIAAGNVQWAATSLSVHGDDLEGLVITPQPAITIAGNIVFDAASGAAPVIPLNQIPSLPAFNTSIGLGTVLPPGAIDGTAFHIRGVIPGVYRFVAPPQGIRTPIGRWWLASITVNGHELLDAELDLRQNSDSAVVTFTDRPSVLSGTVRYASGLPMTQEWVIVFSKNPAGWFHQSRRVAAVRPTPAGGFTIRNLPPGDYFAAVSVELLPNEWFDPELLRELARDALPFTIAPHEVKALDLRLTR